MTSPCKPRQRGFTSVLALFFLAVMCGLSVALFTSASMELQKSENLQHVAAARLEAEGGLAFLTYQIRRYAPAELGPGQELLDSLAGALGSALNGSGTLQGGQVAYDGSTILIPPISATSPDRSFHGAITLVDQTTILLRVTGASRNVTRSVGVRFGLQAGGYASCAFDFGIASKGPIRMSGNATVRGATSAEEADAVSAVYGEPEAFQITGNTEVQGDIYASDPSTKVNLNGSIKIGGELMCGSKTLPDPDDDDPICDHVHVGVGPVAFPEVNPGQFEAFAVNEVNASTNTSGNQTFTNIRIKANSNKTFAGNVKLEGVIFIEVPNRIHFSGNVEITGVIVTQDAGDDAYDENTIKFSGNLISRGVEELDGDGFTDLRGMPGSFILAPGFGVEFVGNFGTINGYMAADEFKWTGNAGGIVKGGIIAYSTAEFKLAGNSCITIDRGETPGNPAGFTGPGSRMVLVLVPTTYVEY